MPSNGNRRSWPRTCARLLNLDLPIVEWAREEGIDETQHPRTHRPGGGRDDGGEGGQFRPRTDALRREEPAAADARRGVEGAPAGARPSAPGHRPARLRPARPAERVQERGLRAVQRHAGRIEGAGDGHAVAGGTRRRGAGRNAAAAARPCWRSIPSRRWRWPPAGPMARTGIRNGRWRDGTADHASRSAATRWTRPTRQPGATARAMPPAPAAAARSSSTATGGTCRRAITFTPSADFDSGDHAQPPR